MIMRRLWLLLLLVMLPAQSWAALDDTGLVVRYYIDEAASGTAPTDALDGSGVGSAFNLAIDYGTSNLAYVETSGQRGLVSSATTGVQRARKTLVTSDKVITALSSSKLATLELVIDATGFSASGGRIFGITDRTGGNGSLILRASDTGSAWQLAVNSTTYDVFNFAETGRQVIHIVYDSAQAVAGDRLKYSVNGGTLTNASGTIPLNTALTIDNTLDLIMFNRESGGFYDRSMTGTIFYAALYSAAFTQGMVDQNYAVLTSDDDTPTGGAAANMFYQRRLQW